MYWSLIFEEVAACTSTIVLHSIFSSSGVNTLRCFELSSAYFLHVEHASKKEKNVSHEFRSHIFTSRSSSCLEASDQAFVREGQITNPRFSFLCGI
jgi:hypothetical protein